MNDPSYIRDAANALQLVPARAGANAAATDHLTVYLTIVSMLVLTTIGILIFYFSVRYRAGATVDRNSSLTPRRMHLFELAWGVPTLVIFMSFFFWGARLFVPDYRPPADAIQMDVVAKQWMWKIQHPNGVREIDTLHVPVGQDVNLRLTSQDVIHSFFVPALRLKKDAVPGRQTEFWFRVVRPGTYSLLCAEFCGLDHSLMRGRVIAMNPDAYARWLTRQTRPGSPAVQGRRLFTSYGCSGCHGPASAVHAPSFDGIYGRPVPLRSGKFKRVTNAYIRDSILEPRKDIVAGYAPIMPSFRNEVSDADIEMLIAYIKSLADRKEPDR